METYSQIIVFLLSIIGILFGIALSRLAPEEMSSGKKYFLLLKRVLFAMIFAVVVFFAFKEKSFYLLSFFALFSCALFIFEFKYSYFKKDTSLRNDLKDDLKEDLKVRPLKYIGCIYYLLLFSPYFLIQNNSFRLLLASLIFLYGFPLGTLLVSSNYANK